MLLSIDQKGIVNRMLTLAAGLTILAKKVESQALLRVLVSQEMDG